MASTYNGSVANLVDPSSNSPLNSPSHSNQHYEINDALQTLGVWTNYTPVLAQGATVVTYTQVWTRYTRFNKTILLTVRLDVTSAGAAGNSVLVSLPVVHATYGSVRIGTGTIYDASAAITYNGAVQIVGNDYCAILPDGGNNFWGVTPSIALAASDQVTITAFYETP